VRQSSGSRKTKTGYFWALTRDDRPWSGGAPPGVAFTYAPGRGGLHAERILQGFTGILQVDGYAGYNRLIAADRVGPDIRFAYCWAHARRKLVEITRTFPTFARCLPPATKRFSMTMSWLPND
jgi:hypothetical protein